MQIMAVSNRDSRQSRQDIKGILTIILEVVILELTKCPDDIEGAFVNKINQSLFPKMMKSCGH